MDSRRLHNTRSGLLLTFRQARRLGGNQSATAILVPGFNDAPAPLRDSSKTPDALDGGNP